MNRPALSLADHGARLYEGAVTPVLDHIRAAVAEFDGGRAGMRISDRNSAGLAEHLWVGGAVGSLAAAILGPASRPVRAILFDKSAASNWALGWHQDRVIGIAEQIDVAGFASWTRKDGLLHVAPPFDILAAMLTLRVHLDPVPMDNAPLLIAPGSHRLGRIAEPDIAAAVRRCGTHACLAQAGEIWVYATPILHASERAVRPARRRVLQVDYAAIDLPGGLRWSGIGPAVRR